MTAVTMAYTTHGLIPGSLEVIRVALRKLRGMGFKEAVIVTWGSCSESWMELGS